MGKEEIKLEIKSLNKPVNTQGSLNIEARLNIGIMHREKVFYNVSILPICYSKRFIIVAFKFFIIL